MPTEQEMYEAHERDMDALDKANPRLPFDEWLLKRDVPILLTVEEVRRFHPNVVEAPAPIILVNPNGTVWAGSPTDNQEDAKPLVLRTMKLHPQAPRLTQEAYQDGAVAFVRYDRRSELGLLLARRRALACTNLATPETPDFMPHAACCVSFAWWVPCRS